MCPAVVGARPPSSDCHVTVTGGDGGDGGVRSKLPRRSTEIRVLSGALSGARLRLAGQAAALGRQAQRGVSAPSSRSWPLVVSAGSLSAVRAGHRALAAASCCRLRAWTGVSAAGRPRCAGTSAPPPAAPTRGRSWVRDALRRNAEQRPTWPVYRYLRENGEVADSLTCAGIHHVAQKVAAFLTGPAGLRAGDRAVLVYPPGAPLPSNRPLRSDCGRPARSGSHAQMAVRGAHRVSVLGAPRVCSPRLGLPECLPLLESSAIREGLQADAMRARARAGLEFVKAMWGCLYAGVVAVPVCPPVPGRLPQMLPHFTKIVEDSGAVALLTDGFYSQARARAAPARRRGRRAQALQPRSTQDTMCWLHHRGCSINAAYRDVDERVRSSAIDLWRDLPREWGCMVQGVPASRVVERLCATSYCGCSVRKQQAVCRCAVEARHAVPGRLHVAVGEAAEVAGAAVAHHRRGGRRAAGAGVAACGRGQVWRRAVECPLAPCVLAWVARVGTGIRCDARYERRSNMWRRRAPG